MKLLVVCCLVAAALAAPPPPVHSGSSGHAETVKFVNENIGTGAYHYEYAQTDGIKGEATGELKSGGTDNTGYVATRGSFEWVGPDGVTYTGTYVADETGYHPHYTQGQGGAIPEEILKQYS